MPSFFEDSNTLTPEKLKKAYRTLGMQYYLDRNPNGEETFKALNNANEAFKAHLRIE